MTSPSAEPATPPAVPPRRSDQAVIWGHALLGLALGLGSAGLTLVACAAGWLGASTAIALTGASQVAILGLLAHRCGRSVQRIRASLERSVAERTAELAALNARLQADIAGRVDVEAELKRAKEAAESASRSKGEFLANTSHEIRTPMHVIVGMADLLWATPLGTDQRRYVRAVRDAGDHMLGVINDILDFSRAEAGAVELEALEFDVRELAEEAVELLAPRASRKGIEVLCRLAPDLPERVVGDPQRLRQVLVNLLGNAVKFTDQGDVVLGVEREPGGSGRLRFSVADTGIGIPVDKHELIFESFTQVDASMTRRFGGTGLGLAISRQLVKLMGGTIHVDSEPGRGSIFHFSAPLPRVLPRPRNRNTAGEKGTSVFRHVRDRAVVVADEHPLNRLLLVEMLRRYGATVVEAATGQAVLEVLQRSSGTGGWPVVVFLTPSLGDVGAPQVVAGMAALPGARPAVVLVESHGAPEDARLLGELGVHAVLRKPIKRRGLAEALEAVFEPAVEPVVEPGCEPGAPTRRPWRDSGATPSPEPAATPTFVETPPYRDVPRLDVLVVDDAEDNRLLIQAFFRHLPWRVDLADNGAEAVERAAARRYDVVLMDVQMPVLDGYEATRAIRAREQAEGLPPVPIVALTAHALENARRESRAAGCTLLVTKPVKQQRLVQTLLDLAAGLLPQADAEPDEPPRSTAGRLTVRVDPLLAPLIPTFLHNRRQDVRALTTALERGDFDFVRQVGHSMKGSGGSYGFDAISELGRSFERAADSRDEAAVAGTLAELCAYLDRVDVVS